MACLGQENSACGSLKNTEVTPARRVDNNVWNLLEIGAIERYGGLWPKPGQNFSKCLGDNVHNFVPNRWLQREDNQARELCYQWAHYLIWQSNISCSWSQRRHSLVVSDVEHHEGPLLPNV
jgi:hypothetical protein